jgi:hypothetical protein
MPREGEQLVGGLFWAVLSQEVRGVDSRPAYVAGPWTPDVEHVAVEAREGTAQLAQLALLEAGEEA